MPRNPQTAAMLAAELAETVTIDTLCGRVSPAAWREIMAVLLEKAAAEIAQALEDYCWDIENRKENE